MAGARALWRATGMKDDDWPSVYEMFIKENECWICNDVPGKWQLWSCGHIICEECGDQWLEREGTCVLCRMAPGYISVYEN